MNARTNTLTRDEATRRVMKALVMPHNKHASVEAEANGRVSVVVALPNEHVSEVAARVRAMGGSANVVVAFATHFSMMKFGAPTSKLPAVEINQDLSMGMFLIKVQNNPGKSIHFRFKDVDTEVPSVNLQLEYA